MAEEYVEKNDELTHTEKAPAPLDPHLRDPIREKFPDELELVGENEEFERMPLVQRIQLFGAHDLFLYACGYWLTFDISR